jgi:hypothetical protein
VAGTDAHLQETVVSIGLMDFAVAAGRFQGWLALFFLSHGLAE